MSKMSFKRFLLAMLARFRICMFYTLKSPMMFVSILQHKQQFVNMIAIASPQAGEEIIHRTEAHASVRRDRHRVDLVVSRGRVVPKVSSGGTI